MVARDASQNPEIRTALARAKKELCAVAAIFGQNVERILEELVPYEDYLHDIRVAANAITRKNLDNPFHGKTYAALSAALKKFKSQLINKQLNIPNPLPQGGSLEGRFALIRANRENINLLSTLVRRYEFANSGFEERKKKLVKEIEREKRYLPISYALYTGRKALYLREFEAASSPKERRAAALRIFPELARLNRRPGTSPPKPGS